MTERRHLPFLLRAASVVSTLAARGAERLAGRGHAPRGRRATLERQVETLTAELERARQAAEAGGRTKSAFLDNMSHELRTPMTGILGVAELLLDGELAPEQRYFLDIIRSSSQELLQLLNDLLDLARIEAGQMQLDRRRFEVRTIAADTARLLAPAAAQKGVGLDVEVAAEVPDALVGDPHRVRQVFMNLVSNAVKFTDQGRVTARVALAPEGAAGVTGVVVHFTVSDTGIGIPPAQRRQIFDAFVQADGTSTRKFGGTGLGLAISAELVRMMGGAISLDSEAGRGSTFHVILPFDLPIDDRQVSPAPIARPTPVDG
jgi:signal transduction histidine kinase